MSTTTKCEFRASAVSNFHSGLLCRSCGAPASSSSEDSTGNGFIRGRCRHRTLPTRVNIAGGMVWRRFRAITLAVDQLRQTMLPAIFTVVGKLLWLHHPPAITFGGCTTLRRTHHRWKLPCWSSQELRKSGTAGRCGNCSQLTPFIHKMWGKYYHAFWSNWLNLNSPQLPKKPEQFPCTNLCAVSTTLFRWQKNHYPIGRSLHPLCFSRRKDPMSVQLKIAIIFRRIIPYSQFSLL